MKKREKLTCKIFWLSSKTMITMFNIIAHLLTTEGAKKSRISDKKSRLIQICEIHVDKFTFKLNY